MSHPTFYRTQNNYQSCSVDPWTLSPAYVVAATAKQLLDEGHHIDLPDGYTIDTLKQITYHTGAYGKQITISNRQAQELAHIGSTLLKNHHSAIAYHKQLSISELINTTTP